MSYSACTNLCYTQAQHPRLIGAVGTLDGLKLPVEVSTDSHTENAMYNRWLHSHFVSNVIAFAPTGLVLSMIEPIQYSSYVQERSFMHHSMPLEVGTTPELLVPSTNCYRRSYQLDTTWFLIQHFRRVPVGVLGRYVHLFKRVQVYQLIQTNLPMFSPSTANSSHSDNPQNGGCVP